MSILTCSLHLLTFQMTLVPLSCPISMSLPGRLPPRGDLAGNQRLGTEVTHFQNSPFPPTLPLLLHYRMQNLFFFSFLRSLPFQLSFCHLKHFQKQLGKEEEKIPLVVFLRVHPSQHTSTEAK